MELKYFVVERRQALVQIGGFGRRRPGGEMKARLLW